MMNTERAALKGHLSDRKMRRMELSVAIQANLRAAKAVLATATIDPVLEVDIAAALVHLGEARRQQERYQELTEEIARIEAELA